MSVSGVAHAAGERDRLHHPEPPFAAVRAVQPFDACHPPHERLHRFNHDRIGGGRCQSFACYSEIGCLVRRHQQTVVADTLEAAVNAI